MTGQISSADIADLKTAFYTLIERDDTGASLIAVIRTEAQSMSKPPNWLLADCFSHLFRSYGRFYHVANRRSNRFQFVDCPLTQHQKDAFRAMDDDPDALYTPVPELLKAGYKVTTSWNGMRHAFCCTLLAPDTSANAERGLSAFAGDIFTALRLVVFKHVYVLEGDWKKAAAPSDDDLLG